MDEYNRTTYVYGNPLRTNINKALLKMPGARETLPAAVDVLGRKVKGHNSVADAFINPVNYGEENTLQQPMKFIVYIKKPVINPLYLLRRHTQLHTKEIQ